jgi:hypothetical protein
MVWIHPAAVEHRARLFTRHDADRYMRPDAERRMSPEELRLENPQAYERKYGGLPRSQIAAHDDLPDETLRREIIALLRDAQRQIAEIKHALVLRRKANFNPDQPRHPKHSPGSVGGRWSGGSSGLPLGPPPKIPRKRPPNSKEKNLVLKEVARWLARAIRVSAPIHAFMLVYEAASWLDTDRPLVEAYYAPPKTLPELQEDALTPKSGYDIHHVVEKDSASKDGFARSMIEGLENRVRISRMKHWEITAWHATKNEDYNNMSPREYLRGKSWAEREAVGLYALKKFGVLKP